MKQALLIDGANTHTAAQACGFKIDFGKLRTSILRLDWQLVHCIYYTAIHEDDTGNIALQGLVDYLEFNEYVVRSKPTKVFSANGKTRMKGNMDCEIATDMVRFAAHCDHIILCSGDNDFAYPVQIVQDMGCSVTVISTREKWGRNEGDKESFVCGDVLRRRAYKYVDLMQLKDKVELVHEDRKNG